LYIVVAVSLLSYLIEEKWSLTLFRCKYIVYK